MTGGHRDVVAVGASAGGVEALRALCGGLPPDFPGIVLMVLHVPRDGPTALPAILSRSGPLPAALAVDGETPRRGRIYIAPNDFHLLIIDGRLRLSRGPTENGHRPAIDPLFRSVARAYTTRAVGVVLSGARDDGAAGLALIAVHGGSTVVQDPDDALYPSMPRAALEHTKPDHVVAASKLGGLLAEISAAERPEVAPPPADALLDAEVAIAGMAPITTDELTVGPAGYGCPSCGGSLFEIPGSPIPRYRCRVGHAWSPDSLLDEQAVALEGALWMALRALEEKSALSRRMAAEREGRRSSTGPRFRDIAEEAEAAGATIRDLIARIGAGGAAPESSQFSDQDVR
jgi:two-component system, chemotaxis family, protein-glutamate methylesterase/glutaminase